jgi:hypothetical protein
LTSHNYFAASPLLVGLFVPDFEPSDFVVSVRLVFGRYSRRTYRENSMDLSEWYSQFLAMKKALFAGPPDEVQQARAFYETIVGDPAIVR